MLSEAIHLLLPPEITVQHLQQASALLTIFCANIKLLYGAHYELANCHCLLHLVESVRQLGPLWTHSCFHFEDANGFILKLIHGTQSIQSQIVSAMSMVQALPVLTNKCIETGSRDLVDFLCKLQGGCSNLGVTRLEDHVYSLGTVTPRKKENNEFVALSASLGKATLSDCLKTFNKMKCKINGIVYYSSSYAKCKIRNNYTVLYEHNLKQCFGQIMYFFQYT